MGGVGSIGAVRVHLEISSALEQMGITPTLIYSGKHKVDGNAVEPLPENVREDFQATIDELRDLFARTVERGRASAGMDAAAALATEAYSYERPSMIEEARRIGLIDAVLNPDEAFEQLAAAVN